MTSCVSAAAKVNVDQGSARNQDRHLTSPRADPLLRFRGRVERVDSRLYHLVSLIRIRQCSEQPGWGRDRRRILHESSGRGR